MSPSALTPLQCDLLEVYCAAPGSSVCGVLGGGGANLAVPILFDTSYNLVTLVSWALTVQPKEGCVCVCLFVCMVCMCMCGLWMCVCLVCVCVSGLCLGGGR